MTENEAFDASELGLNIQNVQETFPTNNRYPCIVRFRKLCGEYIPKYLPIICWLPKYNFVSLQCDIIAGLTVALMVVPQALAGASIARLPPQYGLYTSFMACFVYCLLGTSKDVTLGPTTILSLMVATYCDPTLPGMAVLFSFLMGLILLVMGIFRLGFIVRFVSIPVICGFTSAAAITIALTQLKELTGLKNLPQGLIPNLVQVFSRIKLWNWYDVLFGSLCIALLIGLMHLGRINRKGEFSRIQKALRQCCWVVGFARNAIVVVMSMVVTYVLTLSAKYEVLTLVSSFPPGLPKFKVSIITLQHNIYW